MLSMKFVFSGMLYLKLKDIMVVCSMGRVLVLKICEILVCSWVMFNLLVLMMMLVFLCMNLSM